MVGRGKQQHARSGPCLVPACRVANQGKEPGQPARGSSESGDPMPRPVRDRKRRCRRPRVQASIGIYIYVHMAGTEKDDGLAGLIARIRTG